MHWPQDGLAVAVRSSIVGYVCGGLLGAVVARTDLMVVMAADPMYVARRFAVMLGVWGIAGAVVGFVMGCVLAVIGATFAIASDAAVNSRRFLRSRRFWRAFWLSIPLATCLSLMVFWRTYRAYGTDGYECVGWPVVFFIRGGSVYKVTYDFLGLFIDVVLWIAITTLAGLLMRFGPRRLGIKAFRLLRGRT